MDKEQLRPYRTHTIKILKDFADDIMSGRKTFEVRENDRGYQAGDHVIFNVVDDYIGHDLEEKEYEITYVLSGWGIKEGYVVFGIKTSYKKSIGKTKKFSKPQKNE